MDLKRSSRIIMTNEARVLRDMRIACGLSMRRAGALLNLSDSYIAHIETGRMDIPKGEKLDRLLGIYGGIKQKSFFEKVRNYQKKLSPKDQLFEILDYANEAQIVTMLAVAMGLVPQYKVEKNATNAE